MPATQPPADLPVPPRAEAPDAAAPGAAPAPVATPAAPGAGGGWQASLDLGFERRNGITVLAHTAHRGPLVVQRPFYPEDEVCHVYIVHPPGGVVAGDELAVEVRVAPGAHALVTTPAAGKFYRSTGAGARLHQNLRVDDGTLEWLPQENIFFPGAQAVVATSVQLSAKARFFSWEISCLGLRARHEPFHTGAVRQSFDLQVDGRWLFSEHQPLEREAIEAPWGLAGQASVGTLVAYPAGEHELAQARGVAAPGLTFGASLVDGVLVCRAIGQRADLLREAFVAVWRGVRPLMPGRKATLPRVWAT